MRLPSPRLLHTLLVLAALLALSQLIDAGRLFERRSVPREWLSVRRASPASSVHFVVGLRSASEAAMADTFWSISEPSSQRYLQLLSEHDIEQRFGASAADRQLVTQWLLAAGVSESSMQHVSSAIEVSTSAEVAERLFATEMRLFRHATSGKQVVKAWGTAELPEHIHVAVDIVTGLSSFPIPRRARIRSQRGSDEQPELVVPQTIRAMYTVRPQQAGSSSATQAVIEFAPQYFSNADTAIFAAAVGYTAANATLAAIPDEHIVGTNVPTFAGIEAALDVEMIAATNLEVQTWFWIEAGSTWMYEYALHALNSSSRPQVVSISWGWYEGLQCHFDAAECELLDVDGRQYSALTNALFMKLGMLGVSIVVASGDSGANGRTDEQCLAPTLRPEFPASSPYVTTVGATMVVDASYGFTDVPICTQGWRCITTGREVAVTRQQASFTSGGGFSNISGATRPAYQQAAVQAYFTSGVDLPPSSYYNVHGRGEPDVAALGNAGFIVVDGEETSEGGTSMAAPVFAGVVSLLNEIVLNKTGRSIGFLNPLLYKMAADMPDAFHDIVDGDNICPEQYCGPNCKGFKATKGWDPVTGLGTPNAARMEKYVSALMDDVLLRRALLAARADETSLASSISSSASSAPLQSSHRLPPSPPIVRRPFARSLPRSSSEQPRAALNSYGTQPSEVWEGVQFVSLSALGNDSLAVATESSILQIDIDSYQVTANYSVSPDRELLDMAASNSNAYLRLLDPLYGINYIEGIDVSTGSSVSSVALKYETKLLAVNGDGSVALTSASLGKLLVLFDTATGARRAVISNESRTEVLAYTLNPASSDVWVVWAAQTGSSSYSQTIDVVSLDNSSTIRFSISLPPITAPEHASAVAVTIDPRGEYAYVTLLSGDGSQFSMLQYNAVTGAPMRKQSLPAGLQPSAAPVAGGRPGSVYYLSANLIALATDDGITSTALGKYPYMSQPIDVAVAANGDVLVAQNYPSQVMRLNQHGQLLTTFPVINEYSLCDAPPTYSVATDLEGRVYTPICNSTILVYSSLGQSIAAVYTGNNTIPRSVAPGPSGTLFYLDSNQPGHVQQIARNGSLLQSWTSPLSTSQLLFIKYDCSSSLLYASDYAGGVVLLWAVNDTSSTAAVVDVSKALGQPASPWGLAVDSARAQLLVTVSSGASDYLLWIDIGSGRLSSNFTFPSGGGATGVDVSADGSRVYATDARYNRLYVFEQAEAVLGAGRSRLARE